MKNLILFLLVIINSSLCWCQSEKYYTDIDSINKFAKVTVDKKHLKSFTLHSILQKCDSFKKLNKIIDKEKDYYIEMDPYANHGFFKFEERIDKKKIIFYQFNDSLLTEVFIIKTFWFKYKELDIPLSLYSIYQYYKKGTLKIAWFSIQAIITDDFPLTGIFFDEKGKLIKKLNYDKHYRIKLLDIIKMGYKNLRLNENDEMFITRSFNEKEAFWIIEYNQPDEEGYNRYLIINDKTKEINTKYYRYEIEKFKFEEYQKKLINIDEIFKESKK